MIVWDPKDGPPRLVTPEPAQEVTGEVTTEDASEVESPLEDAIQNVMASKFQFGCTTDILRLRAERVAALAQAAHHAKIVEAVEGVTNYTFTEEGEPLVPINDILAALAALNPRGEQ